MMDINAIKRLFLDNAQDVYNNNGDKTAAGLEKAALTVRSAMSMMGMDSIDDEAYEELLAQLQEMVSVTMNFDGGVITGEKDYHHWLASDVANIDWKFWKRYRSYLTRKKGWPSQVVQSLDKASNDIVDLAGDPRQEEGFLRKGLIIGDVQSGKTATYTAILNKAVDAGYKVCIVLTGMLEDLRRQTQSRLDAEFAGRSSYDTLNNPSKRGRKRAVGVGEKDPSIYVAQFTSTTSDFDAAIVDRLQLDIKDITVPVLFVVKKQKNILTNLAVWLERSVNDRTNKIMQPMLLIDDEADNASINTSGDDNSPTAINKGIRRILNMFYKAAYIGVTATPFANIFIQPDIEDENQSDEMEAERFSKADLFPSNFIYALNTPSNYIGATKIFGDESSYGDDKAPNEYMLEEINTDEMEQIIPYKHKKELEIHKLPSDLERALYYFLLMNAVRDCRVATQKEYKPDKETHRSMMIHVSRFTAVQSRIYDLVNDWLDKVKSEIENYAALPKTAVAVKDSDVLNKMQSIYTEMLADNVKIDWEKLRRKYLHKAVAGIEIRLQNSAKRKDNSKALDYNGYNEGLRVIAVGGNSFSRGLTLEGLCVTFFYRRSLMYDTLMQMGRWFGYRPWCADLCRIWLAPDAIGWYRYITNAIEELKDQIRYMQSQDLTPSEFGLRVRRHPASLIVTARNKMRSAETVRRAVTLSHRYLESPNLLDNAEALEQNRNQFINFIKRLPPVHTDQDVIHPDVFWRGVSGEVVAGLVTSFKSSHWNLAFQGNALYRYIRKNLSEDIWDVVIATGGSSRVFNISTDYGKISVHPICRTITKRSDVIQVGGSRARISTVDITKNGLTEDQFKYVKELFYDKEAKKQKNPSSSGYMIKNRRPLLALFFIEPTLDSKNPVDLDTLPPILCALGLGFPSTGEKEKTIEYEVNLVDWQNEYAGMYDDEE